MKRAHKTFAYLVLLLSQGALATGMHFYRINPKHASDVPLEWIHLGIMAIVVAVLEYRHQVGLNGEVPFRRNMDTHTLSLHDFEARVQKGEKLVILDDLVLDVSRFMGEHPGGHFTLEHNVGRDISKFFYGGYSLENQSKVPEHAHSNDARKIVNGLIVGRLIQEASTR